MRKMFNRNGREKAAFLVFMLLLILVFSCSNESEENYFSEYDDTAPAIFTIAWNDELPLQPSSKAMVSILEESDICETVTEIVCEVYDAGNNFLTSAFFECSARTGIVVDLPVGSDREFVLLGMNAEGDILYHGSISGVTIVGGQTNDLGAIDVSPFYVSELLTPDNGASVTMEGLSLTWTQCEAADKYRVWISADESFNTLVVDEFTTGESFIPSSLLPSETYYWKVFACDNHENQGPAPEEIQSFTLFPDIPEGVWYNDSDSDGYGDPNVARIAANRPVGYVSNNSDCNDMDDTVYPGAEEICGDGIDQDCDGDDLVCLSCADISGSWCGDYSEIDCFGESWSGSWEGEVGADCSLIAYSDWGEFMAGTIDPETLALTATGSGNDCGSVSVTGQWGEDTASGSYTYSDGGSGTFTGSRCE